ncbi:hypothetical protein Tco_0261938 [Tanacetum coccineum]
MTNKIDTVLKAITDRVTGALPSDTVKNLKLNVNSTSLILSARPYLKVDPQCSSHPSTSINDVKTCSTETNHSQKRQLQTMMGIETQQTKDTEQTLADEFKDLHLNLPVLKVRAQAPIYNAILDKYVESLELGKNGLGDSEPFDTLADLGACINIILLYLFKKLNIGLLEETDHVFGLADGTNRKRIPSNRHAVIDYRKAKITVGEGITRLVLRVKGVKLSQEEAPYWTTLGERESYKPRPSSNGVGAQTLYYSRKDFLDYHLSGEWEIARDAEINPFKEVLPDQLEQTTQNRDGAWHVKIRLVDPDGDEFTKTLQSVPTSRKLSERGDLREIIDLDHFYNK